MPFRSVEDVVREGVGLPPKVSTGEDVARSGATGAVEGFASVAGGPGDLIGAGKALLDKGFKFAGDHGFGDGKTPRQTIPSAGGLLSALAGAGASKAGLDPRLARLVTAMLIPGGLPSAPTTPEIVQALNRDKPTYQPQTKAGERTRTGTQFLAAAAMPGSIPRRIANVAVPAAASQAAGEMTEGTAAEPYARVVAALAGAGGVAAVGRAGPQTRMLAEASRGATDAQIAQARQLMEQGQREGVQLTSAEALQQVTNSGTGMSRMQRVLEGTKAGSERMSPVMSARPAQTRQAVMGFADSVAPATDQPSMIGAQAQQAAEGGLTGVRRFINAGAEPNYQALEGQTVPDAQYAQMAANPSYAEALAALRAHPELGAQVAHLPDNNMAVVNEVVKRLGTTAEQVRPSPVNPMGDNGLAALRDQAAGAASEVGTAASPEYAAARQGVAAGRQEYLEPLQRGPLGAISNTDSVKAQTAALFPSQPLEGAHAETTRAMGMLADQSPAAGPNLTRQHLVNALSEATQENIAGPNQWGGAKYAAQIAGNPEQERALMAGVQGAGGDSDRLAQIVEVLRATGRRERPGSLTAYNAKDVEELGKAGMVGEVARTGLNPPGIFRRIGQGLQDWQTERNAGRLAEAILAEPAQAEQILLRARQVVPQGQALAEIERLALSAQAGRQPALERH